MEQIISIIGTRPQYIKIKPVDDYCKKNGIDHLILDSGQHYSPLMSSDMIKDLDLSVFRVDNVDHSSELAFISSFIKSIRPYLNKDAKYLVIGDTNTSFVSALVLKKLGLEFGHVESGVRCGDVGVPEEVNRIYVDTVANHNFCTQNEDKKNVHNGIFVGDLEYEYLNSLDIETSVGDYAVMTLHRQRNMNQKRVKEIFSFIEQLGIEVRLFGHHRLIKQKFMDDTKFPKNLHLHSPLVYSRMVKQLAGCRFILTDSGSIPKTAPFFGKKVLVFRDHIGWKRIIDEGYGQLNNFDCLDWLYEPIERKKDIFGKLNTSETIVNTLIDLKWIG